MLDDAEACDWLNQLRRNRIGQYVDMQYSGEELINEIREERRKELCLEGHRWFDIRRYAVSKVPMTKEIRHPHWESNTVTSSYEIDRYYVLKPYSEDRSNYVMSIPQKELMLNEGTMVNNERVDSEYIKM